MKQNVIMIAAACLFMASCGGKKDAVTLDWIPDAEPDRKPATLFGDVPDSIISELGLGEGIPSSMSAYLLRNGKSTILFDAGIGSPDSRLVPALAELGVGEADVDRIFITHMHPDHIGGIMKAESFPKAEIWIPGDEYRFWADSDNARCLAFMEVNAGRIHVFEAGEALGDGIRAIPAPGHTPGHTVYQVGSYLIIGDLIHGAALQLAYPEFSANFDMDRALSVESRKFFIGYAADNGLTMAGMHTPAPGFIE